MEVYNFPEHGHADTYLIQGTELNPYLTSPLEQFEAMYNEGAPEFVVEQGLYYPTATNYGYICTGLESPGEWDDHNRMFGLDGQDIQYTGAQTESLPYLYYTPSYGYTQSPYNPYNPYIPGAMIGVDGSFVGTQQYYTIPSYDSSISSPAYFPVVVQSSPDMIANGTAEPFMNSSSSTANRADGPGPKHNLSAASANFNLNPARSVSNQTISLSRVPEGSKANAGPSKQSSTQIPQGSGAQVIDNLSHGKSWSNRNQLKASLPSGNGMSNFGSSANGRVMVDKSRPKFHIGRVPNDVNNSPDALGEQNRGPRTNKSKNQLALKAYTTRAGDCDEQGNIIICTDQYNKDDFPVDYVSAKFFVIKSYSEDDVHKSIKYNVWSSTPNGNKKLNSAYEDAQKTAALESRICPIFLFFSVNASGQFCGVAEMTGPVDFHKDMDFWQQDKWSGSFPVKWHIVKDLPNPNFRHIILENNENKPVTNSRDTQEIRFKKGMEMLRIFKNYTSKTSLLDDFMYYENRQKILQEEKARLLIKSYGSPFFVPVIDPPRKLNYGLNRPFNEDEKPSTENNNLNSSENNAATSSEQPLLGADVSNPIVGNEKSIDRDLLKIGSLSINAKQAAGSKPLEGPSRATSTVAASTIANSEPVDIVTVGSMPVKVNGFSKSTGFLTVGTIPLDPRSLQLDEAGVSTTRGSHKG